MRSNASPQHKLPSRPSSQLQSTPEARQQMASGNNFGSNVLSSNLNMNQNTFTLSTDGASLTCGEVAKMGIKTQIKHPQIQMPAEQLGHKRMPSDGLEKFEIQCYSLRSRECSTEKWGNTALFPKVIDPDVSRPQWWDDWLEKDHAAQVPPNESMVWIHPSQRSVVGCLNLLLM